jgi:glycosyltransferase involved in cell wall biosynthesis
MAPIPQPEITSKPSVPAAPLQGIRVLVLVSGHDVGDHRVYGKEACSFIEMGADVTLVGHCRQTRPGNVRLIELPAPRSRLVRFLVQPWRCLWRSRKVQADVIHFHDAEVLFTLPLARLLRRKARFVYDVHEDFSQLIKVRGWIPRRLRSVVAWTLSFLEKRLAGLAHGVVGVTPPLTAKFRRVRAVTARNFITRQDFELAGRHARPMRQREYDIVHLGTLRASRAQFLVEVLGAIHQRRPGARSLVVGCAEDMCEPLRSRVPAGCDVLGPVPHGRVPVLLGNARIGLDVHPWREPHLEVALPVKVCEYLASQCGVVCSSMPVLDELCAQSGADLPALRILRGGEPADYAHACLRLLEDTEHLEDAGRENRDFAFRHLHWDQEAERIADLYLTLLGPTKTRA